MIPSQDVPLPIRDLLWHLPDLLAGEDPVLLRGDVIQRVAEDPRTATTLSVAGALSCALSRGRSSVASLPIEPPAGLLRSIGGARRIFDRRLADVLFEAAMIEFHRAMEQRGEAYGSMLRIHARPRRRDLLAIRDELAAVLGISSRRLEDPASQGLLRAGHAKDPMERARALMEACDSTLPGQPGTRFHRLLFDEHRSRPLTSDDWLEFAKSISKSTVQAAALQCAAVRAASDGGYGDAVEFDRIASRLRPQGVLGPYHATLHAALAGDARFVTSSVDSWSECIADWGEALDLVDRQIRNDAALWQRALLEQAAAVELVIRAAPGQNVSTLEALLP